MIGNRGEVRGPDDVKRWGPRWSRHVGRFLAHVYWHTRVYGAETFPEAGPVIVASNHIGVIDGPLLHGVVPRGSHFIVKKEFFTAKIGFLMDWAGQIPVDRANGRSSLAIARTFLEEGRVVGIFPEGTRGAGRAEQVRAGVAWLALQTGAPIVPAACLGTRPKGASVGYVPRPRADLHVVFGEAFSLGGFPKGREGTAAAIAKVSEELRSHVDAAVALTGVELPGDEGTRTSS